MNDEERAGEAERVVDLTGLRPTELVLPDTELVLPESADDQGFFVEWQLDPSPTTATWPSASATSSPPGSRRTSMR